MRTQRRLFALMLILSSLSFGGSFVLQAGEPELPMGLPLPPPPTPPPPPGPDVEEPSLVVIVDVPGTPPYTYTLPPAGTVGDFLQQVRDFFIETTYNKLGLSFDEAIGPLVVDPTPVVPTIPLPFDWACELVDAKNYTEEVTRILMDPPYDVNFADYDHVVVFAPFGSGCGWDGVYFNEQAFQVGGGDFGPYDVPGVDALAVNVSSFELGTVAHEFGHSIQVGPQPRHGLDHAFRLQCDTSFQEDATWCHTGTGKEYQDTYGVMGGLNHTAFHFNAVHKDLAGWFDPGAIVNVRQSGTFTVQAIEPDFGLRALKICRVPGKELYVETRRAVGFDTDIEGGGLRDVVNGALLHTRDRVTPPPGRPTARPYASHLIDPSPELPNDESCGILCATDRTPTMKPGDTLYDATGGITLHLVSSNHRTVTVDVTLDNDLSVARPVENVQCGLFLDRFVSVAWELGDCYDEIEVLRNGQPFQVLDGFTAGTGDDPGSGEYTYTVIGRIAGLPDSSDSCTVTVP